MIVKFITGNEGKFLKKMLKILPGSRFDDYKTLTPDVC